MRRIAVVAGAAALLAACTGRSSGPQCQLNSDCQEGQTCRDGQCAAGCSSDRDCPTNTRCLEGQCAFPVGDGGAVSGDAGRRDGGGASSGSSRASSSRAGVSSSAGAGSSSSAAGAAQEEEICNAATLCAPGLDCVNLGAGLGAHCLTPCAPAADGGTVQSTCRVEQKCLPATTEGGYCLRMAARDQMCTDPLTGAVDPMLLCEPGLTRLVDDPADPTICGCKLLCSLGSCPGAACECATGESCIAGVVNSATQGACGTPLQPWDMCDNPFDYPFSSSEYCVVPASVTSSNKPIPQCWYPNFDFTNFQSYCQLLCDYPGYVTNAACPMGMLCLPASEDAWGPDVRTCQIPGMFQDAGPNPFDAGSPDAGRDAGVTDAGRDAGTTDAAVTDAGRDAGPADAAVTDAAVTDAGRDAGLADAAVTDAAVTGATDAARDAG
ncbi:MAG: hypothetical protein HY904_02485 [Deltaproteobacteria bacterium]|nr:hypothetical protein [Deltaproteobacteria bacterium]